MKEEEVEYELLEQKVFRALDHQVRRDILRYIGEKKHCTFTEILNATKVPDSPTLSYHLKNLAPFTQQQHGRYHLSLLGKDAYNLLLRTGTYNKLALFEKKKYEAAAGNTVIWIAAIIAAAYLNLDPFFTTIILPILAAVSISATYQLYK